MRSHGRFLLRLAPALAPLLAAGGCSLPGTFGISTDPAQQPSTAAKVAAAVHGAPPPSNKSIAPATGPGPAPIMPLNLVGPESPQDLISIQQQSLHDLEDNRNLIAARLAQVDANLQERERQLGEAVDEVRKTEEEVARARAEGRRLMQEGAAVLRKKEERIQLLEEVNKALEKKLAQPENPPMVPEPGKAPE